MSGRAASRLAWGLWVLFFPLAVSTKYLEAQTGELFGSVVESLALIAAFAVFATIGALVASRRSSNAIGWILLGVGLGTVFTAFAGAYATYALVARPGSLPGGGVMAWLQSWTWYPSSGMVFTFLILLFPTGRLPSSRWRPLAWADGLLIATLVAPAALAPEITVGGEEGMAGVILDNPMGLEAMRGGLDVVEAATGPIAVVLFGLGVASVFFRYRSAEREERQQLKWFLYATAVAVVGMLLGELAPDWAGGNLLFAALVALIPVSIAIAVLKYRLYDIDVVINKTLVYGALAGVITAVYVGLVVGLGSVIGAGGQANIGLQIAATAVVAVAFQPARARVQRLANRLVYGRRAEPYEVLGEFAERMAGSVAIEEILPRTAEAAARGVGAARARVRLLLPDGSEQVADWPSGDGASIAFDLSVPVRHLGEVIGDIAVAKPAGDAMRGSEEALIRDLASQARLALHNVRLTTELRARLEDISAQAAQLRESQGRIMTAADDERRRLEHTMEDRVERPLEAIGVGLRKALEILATEPRALTDRLESLRIEAQSTLEELREIARGIYPPLLADRGLGEALAAHARRGAGAIRLSLGELERYPEEIEASVYFCFVEAIRGTSGPLGLDIRHADASLRLRIEGDLAPETAVRIRDRIEALGGTIERREHILRAIVPARALEAV